MVIFGIDGKADSNNIDFSKFSYTYTCFIIMGILVCLTLIRQLGIFVKFNTYGTIFIVMIILFVIYKGIQGFFSTKYVFSESEIIPGSLNPYYIRLFKKEYPPLMGILGGGYYLHNIALPIMKKSANPEKNLRNIFIGYGMVFLTYTICGVLGYFGFSAVEFTSNPAFDSI